MGGPGLYIASFCVCMHALIQGRTTRLVYVTYELVSQVLIKVKTDCFNLFAHMIASELACLISTDGKMTAHELH